MKKKPKNCTNLDKHQCRTNMHFTHIYISIHFLPVKLLKYDWTQLNITMSYYPFFSSDAKILLFVFDK